MKTGLVYFHQGWSDIINCFSLINHYSENYDKIYLLMRDGAKEFIDFYIKGLKNVEVLYFNIHELDSYQCFNKINIDENIDLLFHGVHDKFRNDKYKNSFKVIGHFVKCLYTCYDIEYINRINLFKFERDFENENIFYENIKTFDKEYIVYHENVDTNALVKFDKDDNFEYINLNGITNNFFHTIKLLENSKELHLTDSLWAAFCYLLDAKYGLFKDKNVYLYTYHENGGACLENYNVKTLEPINLTNWKIINIK
jgi:hypothetical protein